MDVYTTEEEQIEKLKEWFKNYGTTLIISVVIVIVASFAWRYWRGHQETIRQQASIGYSQMMANLANTQTTQLQAKRLISQYPKTPYAKLAALVLAKQAVARGDLAEALTQLQWAIKHASEPNVRQIAKIRVARVLLTQKKPKQALQILQTIDDKRYAGMVALVKGDIYVALGQTGSARQAYQLALAELKNAKVSVPLLQMKINQLAQ